MTSVTRVGYLRPASHERTLQDAAWDSRLRSVRRQLELGLLRDEQNRKLVRIEYVEAETRLKERSFHGYPVESHRS